MTTAPKMWREWMPLDVDALLTSDDVREMTPVEFQGYILLLLHQWKDEEGYLPADEEALRRKARLSPEDWKNAKPARSTSGSRRAVRARTRSVGLLTRRSGNGDSHR